MHLAALTASTRLNPRNSDEKEKVGNLIDRMRRNVREKGPNCFCKFWCFFFSFSRQATPRSSQTCESMLPSIRE